MLTSQVQRNWTPELASASAGDRKWLGHHSPVEQPMWLRRFQKDGVSWFNKQKLIVAGNSHRCFQDVYGQSSRGDLSPLGKGCVCCLVPASWLSPAGGYLSRSGVCFPASIACYTSSQLPKFSFLILREFCFQKPWVGPGSWDLE